MCIVVHVAEPMLSFSNILFVRKEPTNEYNCFAGAVLKNGEIMGHVSQAVRKVTYSFWDMMAMLCFMKSEVNLDWKFHVFISFMAVKLTQKN